MDLHPQIKKPGVYGQTLFSQIDIRSKAGEEELLSVSEKKGVTPRKNVNVTMFKAESYNGYKLCWPGDLVINSLWAWMQGLGFSRHHGIVSTAYGVYRIQNKYQVDYKYFDYLFRSAAYKWELRVRSKGIWRSRYQFTDNAFMTMPVIIPSANEQKQIVRFLKYKCAQIAKFIRNKRRLIQLLKEQKQIIINQAVTRGIDSNVKMKPSGVNWLGDIPETWDVKRLKLLYRNVADQDSSKNEEDIYIALEYVESWTGKLTLPTEDIPFESQVKRFSQNDILFGKLRPYLAKVVRPNCQGVCVGEFLVLRDFSNEVMPEFMEIKLRSAQIIDLINSSTFGAKMPRADWKFIGNVLFSYPKLYEQKAIINKLIDEIRQRDRLIEKAEREIELIQEYRTRLISDVVTGKVDVRKIKVVDVADEELADDLSSAEETEELDDSIEEVPDED